MIPSAARELHLQLSKPAAGLLDLAAANPACRLRPDLGHDLPDWMAVYTYAIQSWPTILEGPKLAQVRRGTLAVPRLIKSIPARLFGNDPGAIARFYGVADEESVRAMLAEPDGLAPALSRGDYLDTPGGFKCLEMNLSACLGGWQIRFFVDRVLRQPWLQDFLRDVAATYVDPLPELFAHLVGTILQSPLGADHQVNIAFLMPPALFAHSHPSFRAFVAAEYAAFLAAHQPSLAGSLVFSTYDRIKEEEGRIFLDDVRLHAIVDYHDPFFDSRMDPSVFASFKARQVHLYNSPAACMLSDKRNIALLSEHQESDLFSAEERQDIRAFIPWSRLARQGFTEFHGERVDLAAFSLAARERLVLKRGRGGQADAVHIGNATPPERWEQLAEQAFAAGDWIVQERQESLPYWFQSGESGAAPHDVVWGMFAFGDRYGGGFLRMVPQGTQGVVSSAHGAAEGLILEIGDEPEGLVPLNDGPAAYVYP